VRIRNEKSRLEQLGARMKADAGASFGPLRTAMPEALEASSNELAGDWESAREYHRHEGALLRVRGGLAPWQIRRVTSHIEAKLHAKITIVDLASLAHISVSHFAHAFKRSFGQSPHRYVLRRRTERAQGLMLASEASLGQIALECGLADQSHFTRLFHRFVGESPGVWRRARAVCHPD
jgi:AraC-like DNA-binding protein